MAEVEEVPIISNYELTLYRIDGSFFVYKLSKSEYPMEEYIEKVLGGPFEIMSPEKKDNELTEQSRMDIFYNRKENNILPKNKNNPNVRGPILRIRKITNF